MIRNKVICHNVVSVHQKQMSAKQGLSPVSHSFFLVDRSEISLRMIILYMILWIRLQNVQSIRKLPRSPVCAGISALPALYQNLSERQLSPPSIFLNSEVSTVMTG